MPRLSLLLCICALIASSSMTRLGCVAFVAPSMTPTPRTVGSKVVRPTPMRGSGALHRKMIENTAAFTVLAETEVWVQPLSLVLGPFLNFMSLAMLSRVVLSWYPETKGTDVPWIFIVLPTEPLLKIAKGFVPPAFGVDITPVFWLAIFTFLNEIFLGQQGLLTMKMKYGI